MSILLGHRIAGRTITGVGVIESRNPSDLSDLVAMTPDGDAAILDEAITAAAAAQPGWAALSPEARGDVLDRAGALLMERADALGELLAREEGKTRAEGRGEVARAARIFRYFGGEALRLHGRTLASVRPGLDVTTHQEPLGVVGLITPWNFPIAIPAWKAAPALAFGNSVVLKPAGITPAIVSAMVDALEEAGLPAGVINLPFVPGRIAARLLDDPRVAAVSFTGSTGVGRSLAVAAAEQGKRVQLEMGGKNPLVIADDADLDRAVAVALDGSFFSSGQRCTASSKLIVTDEIHDRFVEALITALSALRVGHALDPETQVGPVASEEQRDTIESYLSIAAAQGGTIAFGGERLKRATEGYFLAPALITGTTAEMRVNREEIFGPVASVVRVRDLDEAITVANGSEFGLSSGIVTTSLASASRFRKQIQAGMVMVNTPTAGVDYHVPFGGTKASSMGPREQGFAAHEFYTRTKTVYTNP
jgi:alpha-ketoglutaric semialdehyde dehydrogenase